MGVGGHGLKRSLCRVRRRFLGMGGRCTCVWDGEREGGRDGTAFASVLAILSFFFTVTDTDTRRRLAG